MSEKTHNELAYDVTRDGWLQPFECATRSDDPDSGLPDLTLTTRKGRRSKLSEFFFPYRHCLEIVTPSLSPFLWRQMYDDQCIQFPSCRFSRNAGQQDSLPHNFLPHILYFYISIVPRIEIITGLDC